MSDTAPRPSHTTLAAGLVIGGSVGVVIGVADQLAGLHSLETREAVSGFLSEPPGDGLGLDLGGALRLLRVVLMAVAGCATAAAVLGFHVLRRSHRARVGLSVLAVPIFLGGLATGGFLTSLVAASSLLLWVGPSAAWFRGESPSSGRPVSPEARVGQAAPPPGPAGPAAGHDHAHGEAPRPLPSPAARTPGRAGRGRRPDALVWACVLTWCLTGLTLVVLLASAVLMATSPDLVLDELRRQGRDVPARDVELLRATTFVTVAVAGVWSLAAAVVAAVAYRGVRWARVALATSAVVAAVLCLLASVSTLLALLPGAGCLAVVALLSRPSVRTWFART